MAIYNVKNYGAKGDGSTDDTAAIQAAIDAAAADGGGQVYLSSGTYTLSSTAAGSALQLKDFTSLTGDGMGQTVLKLADGSTGATSVVHGDGDSIGASSLTIDGNRAGNSGTVQGWVSGTSDDVTLSAVEVVNASGDGFDLRSVGHQFSVSDSVARFNGIAGFHADGQANSYIHDSLAQSNGDAGFDLGGELTVLDSDALTNGNDGFVLREGESSSAGTSRIVIDGGSAVGNNSNGVDAVLVHGFQISAMDLHGNLYNGILSDASSDGVITQNHVFGNDYDEFSYSEIDISGWTGSPATTANNVSATHNVVTGGHNSYYGITVGIDTGDYNTVADNIVSQTVLPIVVVGEHSVKSNNVAFVRLYGTDHADVMNGGVARDQLVAGDGNDTLNAGAGADVLDGGGGVDLLTTGAGADVVRFDTLADSYRDAAHSYADRITDFDATSDRLDLCALGFSTLGNGHGDTLLLSYNAALDRTYLKHLDADAAGNRFEAVLLGDHRDFTVANLQQLAEGTAAADSLSGSALADSLYGGDARDTLHGLGGDDRLFGDGGGDRLEGGAGADTFVYRELSDSLRSNAAGGTAGRDMVMDFDASLGDQLDVSALGFTGLGDGHGHTLKVSVSADGEQTVLKSLEQNAQGEHFEILLAGDHQFELSQDSILFAQPLGNTPSVLPSWLDHNVYGTGGADTLIGDSTDNWIRGGDGNDRLSGGVGDDTLVGGGGADVMNGDTGNDTFAYTKVSDSFRQGSSVFADTINGFSAYNDRLDFSALGYTGLGDGHGETLKLVQDSGRTFLRDLDGDAQGRLFEVRLAGDLKAHLTADNFVFAEAAQVEPLQLLGVTHGVGDVA
ncbi:glycosyl hydrolase family 28-related protein [Pseudomonas sp. MWU16-30317]|uniref:glycosyl hydrolase family 28-related protein n=1 Tax=Pseudomonas sp. MWU16-30317 TaxID=2878095 RepID=UPI001CFB8913|nr:glycosyl hydrolase family 28-related protein [Pseudomonas sp. MWU16-30317]